MDYASDSSSSSDEVGAFIGFPFAATPLPGGLGRYPFAPAPVSNGIGAPLHFANGLRAPLPFANGLGAPLPYSAGLGNYPNVAAPFPNGLGGYPNMAAPNWDETNGHSEETEEVVDESWSKRELKDECGRRGFRSFNRLNKERLIRLLNGGVYRRFL